MVVINAHINQVSDFNRLETDRLNKEIKALKVEKYVDVSTVASLLSTLETYNGQPILLFTNFSPNNFFVKNGIDVNDFQIKAMYDWQIEEYSFSAGLYHHICKGYSLIGVHFITSVLKRIVNDIDLFSVSGGVKTTIKRKQDWMKPGMNYDIFLKLYLIEKIKEEIKSIAFQYCDGVQ